MNENLDRRTALTVQCFTYVAGKLAQTSALLSPTALHAQVLAEAERHYSALRLMQRDLLQSTDDGLRSGTLSAGKARLMRDAASKTIKGAQDQITRIASQFTPQKLAA